MQNNDTTPDGVKTARDREIRALNSPARKKERRARLAQIREEGAQRERKLTEIPKWAIAHGMSTAECPKRHLDKPLFEAFRTGVEYLTDLHADQVLGRWEPEEGDIKGRFWQGFFDLTPDVLSCFPEDILTRAIGTSSYSFGDKCARSAHEGVYMVAHARDHGLELPKIDLDELLDGCLGEYQRALISPTEAGHTAPTTPSQSAKRQAREERIAAEADVRRACVAIVLSRSDGSPLTSKKIAKAIKDDTRLWDLAREHGNSWCPSPDTIKKLDMRGTKIAAGPSGSKRPLTVLSDHGKRWLQEILAKYGHEDLLE